MGVLSPNGSEAGPFLAVEQAALAPVVGDRERTRAFGWYQLIGNVAQAFGALIAEPNLITLDMGGTSADIGTIQGGQERYQTEFQVGFGIPISVTCVDVATLGAGAKPVVAAEKNFTADVDAILGDAVDSWRRAGFAIDANGGDRCALERCEENAAEAVADGGAEPALERLRVEPAEPVGEQIGGGAGRDDVFF